IVVVLNAGEGSSRRTKIHQNPWSHASQRWNLLQHSELVLVQVRLIFLGESTVLVAVHSKRCSAAEFADENRLLVTERPLHFVGVLGVILAIPPDVFVEADHVEVLAERIIHGSMLIIRMLGFVGC